ncbi:MAG: 50S ribosomal protein L3 [Armatimonadaceae bacterium]
MATKGMLGKKVGMTQIFDEEGKRVIPVTVISVEPNVVSQVRSVDKDGYSAVQLAYEDVNVLRLTRPEQGHLAAAGVQPKRYLKEFDLQDGSAVEVGQEIKADIFAPGEKIRITGVSKGKGFAGVVKRYHFRGGPQTHGSMIHRKPQSSGATDAARTFKGTRKPGHMGDEQVTQQGLRVIRIDLDNHYILVKGAVPGANGGLVVLQKAHRAEKVKIRQESQRSSKKK